MTGEPGEYSFSRYLAAKKDLDDRSLNRHVRETLARHLLKTPKTPPFRVLEVGCGIGTMLERLLDWQLLPEAAYTGIDFNPDNIAEARARRRSYAAARGADLAVAAEFEAIDLFDFLAREQGRATWDLIVAHAFLDLLYLVDLETTLPGLLALLAAGGCFYFTLNFDGATVF